MPQPFAIGVTTVGLVPGVIAARPKPRFGTRDGASVFPPRVGSRTPQSYVTAGERDVAPIVNGPDR